MDFLAVVFYGRTKHCCIWILRTTLVNSEQINNCKEVLKDVIKKLFYIV